jgi:hypothetical protein
VAVEAVEEGSSLMFRQSFKEKGRALCPFKDFFGGGLNKKQMTSEEGLARYAHKAGERFATCEEGAM